LKADGHGKQARSAIFGFGYTVEGPLENRKPMEEQDDFSKPFKLRSLHPYITGIGREAKISVSKSLEPSSGMLPWKESAIETKSPFGRRQYLQIARELDFVPGTFHSLSALAVMGGLAALGVWLAQTDSVFWHLVSIPILAMSMNLAYLVLHECVHDSFLPGKRLNALIGHAVSPLALTPLLGQPPVTPVFTDRSIAFTDERWALGR